MGTKNLYENGPNPFFFIRDQKFGQIQTYGNGFVSQFGMVSTGLCVCVCVCVFFPFILDIKFVGLRSDFSLN